MRMNKQQLNNIIPEALNYGEEGQCLLNCSQYGIMP